MEAMVNQAKIFLSDLFSRASGVIEIRLIDPTSGRVKPICCSNIEDAIKAALEFGERVNVYFGVCTRRDPSAGGGKTNLAEMPGIWADLDGDPEPLMKRINAFDLTPTLIVGSGGGLHCYFLFESPLPVDDVENLERYTRGLARALDADHAWDLSRILRIPGTVNFPDARKTARGRVPAPVTLLRSGGPRYALSDFERLADSQTVKSTSFGADEIPQEISPRFRGLLETDPKVRATWHGNRPELKDQTRSGYDMSMTGLLRKRGFRPEEIAAVLRNMPSGRGAEGASEYLKRTIEKASSNGDGSGTEKNLATTLADLVDATGATLFHDQFKESFAWVPVGDAHGVIKIKSDEFKLRVSHLYWQSYQKAASSEALNTAINTIEARARFEGDQHTLFNRVGWHAGAIWYDLGDGAVRITAEGWAIEKNPPILFRRYLHQKKQVEPIPGGKLKTLLTHVNLPSGDDDGPVRLLFLTVVATMLIPDIPHPVLCVHGAHGSAKTTLCKIVRDLLDPSVTPILSPPDSPREFIQLADHHWLVLLENLNSLPEWLSDALCRCVTGDGFSKRRLFSDNEDVLYSFKRCVGVNGINQVVSKPDLLDRSVFLSLERIPDTQRKTEADCLKAFESEKPMLLGALFTVLSRALAEIDHVNPPSLPRMADFARWGVAVSRALGFSDADFFRALKENTNTQTVEAVEASPVARAVLKFMEKRSEFIDAPESLLKELNAIAEEAGVDVRDRSWPKDSRWLWRRLKLVEPNLEASGIKIKRNRYAGKTEIVLTTLETAENDASIASDAAGETESQDPQGNIFDSDHTDTKN